MRFGSSTLSPVDVLAVVYPNGRSDTIADEVMKPTKDSRDA